MEQYARSAHFHEYMRKEQFNQSINDDVELVSMNAQRYVLQSLSSYLNSQF